MSETRRVPDTATSIVPSTVELSGMTFEKALALVKSEPEKAAQGIMALLYSNTTLLPGTAFVRRAGEMLKKYIIGVRLSESEGHLIQIWRTVTVTQEDGSKKDSKVKAYVLSITGLRQLNQISAIHPLRPTTVVVDGKQQCNPYIEVDPDTRMPNVVYARCVAIGMSPMGSMVATDAMVRLDLRIYFLENLQSKMRQLKNESGRLGYYGDSKAPPDSTTQADKPAARWKFIPILSNEIGIWVNLAAPEFTDTIKDHITRLKFAERLAQSFAERNALVAHPAIPKELAAENGVANVRMTGWTNDFGSAEIDNLRTMVEQGRLHEWRDQTGRGISVTHAPMDDIEPGDAVENDLNAEVAGTQKLDQHERGIKDEEDGQSEKTDAAADLLPIATERFGQLCDLQNREHAMKLLAECGIKVLEEASADELQVFIQKAVAVIGAPA